MKLKRGNTTRRTAELLRAIGWQVFDERDDSANGPDLTIARDGRTYRVEVKSAVRATRQWRIKPVGKSGRACEVLAILLPDHDRVLLQPMAEHEKLTSKDGSRAISMLIELNRGIQ